jgi:hypothetical protein
MVPVFTANRSISLASSFAPAASPRLRRRPSPWPPHRHAKPATESATHTRWPCTAPRPISTRFEPVPRLRSFTTGSSRIPSDLLAGPGPSGSTKPSRLCQRCFPPSPASPGSDCAQLPPGCCDSPARRSRTSFDSQRLTAHRRLMAHYHRTATKITSRRNRKPANAEGLTDDVTGPVFRAVAIGQRNTARGDTTSTRDSGMTVVD